MKTNHTAAEIAEWLRYEPDTGDFFWRRPIRNQRAVGAKAGSIDSNGYFRIMVRGVRYKAHRLAWLLMTEVWPTGEIDHINGVKSDNRFCNLREATPSQQRANCPVRRNSRSQTKNVYFRPKDGKWIVRMRVNGKWNFFGSYANKEEAAHVAHLKEVEIYGEFSHFVSSKLAPPFLDRRARA